LIFGFPIDLQIYGSSSHGLNRKEQATEIMGFANHDAIKQQTCSVSKQFDFRNALTVPLNIGYTPQSMAAMGKVIF